MSTHDRQQAPGDRVVARVGGMEPVAQKLCLRRTEERAAVDVVQGFITEASPIGDDEPRETETALTPSAAKITALAALVTRLRTRLAPSRLR
jgi:hypothetical protein